MTTTEAPAHEPDEEELTAQAPPAVTDDHHDPLHDIDDMKTVCAILGSLALIVFMCWSMSHMFNVLVQVERQEKIGNVKPIELQKIEKEARDELAGKNPNRGTKSIDQAITEYLAK